jgi:Spy/CpxP family protein refolding chaperone
VNTWKVILATMVIFGAGVVTGGLLVHKFSLAASERSAPTAEEHARASHFAHTAGTNRPAQPPSAGMRLDFLRRAQRELDLTAEQRERVDKIMKESQERTRKIMDPVQPQLREEVKKTREEFMGVLTPEQRTRFEEWMKQQHLQQHRPPGHGEHPPAIPQTNTNSL